MNASINRRESQVGASSSDRAVHPSPRETSLRCQWEIRRYTSVDGTRIKTGFDVSWKLDRNRTIYRMKAGRSIQISDACLNRAIHRGCLGVIARSDSHRTVNGISFCLPFEGNRFYFAIYISADEPNTVGNLDGKINTQA